MNLIPFIAACMLMADIPNPKYEAVLRRVEKRCGHLNQPRVQQLRELAVKMHGEGATRRATKKACKAISAEWPTDFRACSNAVLAAQYVPKMVPEPPPPPAGPNISPVIRQLAKRWKALNLKRWKAAKATKNDAFPSRATRDLPGILMEDGSAGILYGVITVDRVQSETTAVVKVKQPFVSTGRPAGQGEPANRRQVFLEERFVLVVNTPTASFADDERVDFDGVIFRYIGKATNGSETIHKLERMDLTADEMVALGLKKAARP